MLYTSNQIELSTMCFKRWYRIIFKTAPAKKNAYQKILTLNSLGICCFWNGKLISHRLNNIFVWHLRIEFSRRKTIHVQMFIQNFKLFSIIHSVKNQQMNRKSMRHKLYGEIMRANHCNRSLWNCMVFACC